MTEWWANLTPVNAWFYVAAVFFSVFFLWQMLAALIGLGGHEDMSSVEQELAADGHADASGIAHAEAGEAHASLLAFKLLSVRSVLAFFTLFTWAGAMYLNRQETLPWALMYALLWGLAALLAVAGLFYLVRRMTETGNPRLSTCVGAEGRVYLDIAADGLGEIRCTVSGVMTHVKARSADGAAVKAGTPVRVVKLLDATTVQVEPLARP